MIFQLIADLLLVIHFLFVIFTVLGGLLLLIYPKLLWIHLSALLWGVVVQWADWVCPLTPLENYFRLHAGGTGYAKGFLEHFIPKILYPESLTLELRYLLGILLIAVNIAVYAYVLSSKRWRRGRA